MVELDMPPRREKRFFEMLPRAKGSSSCLKTRPVNFRKLKELEDRRLSGLVGQALQTSHA